MDGSLVLKVENDGAAVQVLVTGDGPLMEGGGVRVFHDWGAKAAGRDRPAGRSLGGLGRRGPSRRGRGAGGEDEDKLLTALAAAEAGRSHRDIAVGFWARRTSARSGSPTAG